MGATTVEGKTLAPMGAPTESKRRRRIRVAHPAKLPYGGLNRIRFEGSVSTNAGGPARYPRFGVHFTMHGGRRPATQVAVARGVAAKTPIGVARRHERWVRLRSTDPSQRCKKPFHQQPPRRHVTLSWTVSSATSSN